MNPPISTLASGMRTYFSMYIIRKNHQTKRLNEINYKVIILVNRQKCNKMRMKGCANPESTRLVGKHKNLFENANTQWLKCISIELANETKKN